MSGRRSESQATRLSRRCLIELTFQVATSMADPALREGDQGRLSLEHFPPKAWPGLDPGWAPVRRRKCDKRIECRAHSGSVAPEHDSIREKCGLEQFRPKARPGLPSGPHPGS